MARNTAEIKRILVFYATVWILGVHSEIVVTDKVWTCSDKCAAFEMIIVLNNKLYYGDVEM